MSNLKATVATIPGALVVHRLVKNSRRYLGSKKPTVGSIRRAGMTVDDAVVYTGKIFAKIDGFVAEHDGWHGKRVLEIGPGDSLATGLRCLAAGAASYGAVDRFAVRVDPVFERDVFRSVADQLLTNAAARCADVLESVAETEGLPRNSERFSYHNNLPIEQAPDSLGEQTYDIIFSNAVLEHVADVAGTLAACRRLLRPGGVMLHEVDLRSHQTYEKHALQFLEYPSWLWRPMSSHNGEPNRVRMPTYRRIVTELGFDEIETTVVETFPDELIAAIKPKLASEFRILSDDDLSPAIFVLRCSAPLASAAATG